MHETEPEKGLTDAGNSSGPHLHFGVETFEGEHADTSYAALEAQLVTVSLLMRIYDVQMALLSLQDKSMADEIFDAHEKGATFNPPVFIPELSETE